MNKPTCRHLTCVACRNQYEGKDEVCEQCRHNPTNIEEEKEEGLECFFEENTDEPQQPDNFDDEKLIRGRR
jgi:hypothetical protein